MNLENNRNSRRFKDVTKIKNITKDTAGSYGENPTTKFLRDVSMPRIAGHEEKSNSESPNNNSINRTALISEETVDRWLRDYAAKSSPKYAQAYITRMAPGQFLKLTTSTTGRLTINQQTQELDAEKLIEATRQQPIQLIIRDGEVVGHEGRHRVNALMRAGGDQGTR